MSDGMQHVINPHDDQAADLLPYEDESREYRAMRGKRTGGTRVLMVYFVPNAGTHDRYMTRADLHLMDTSKDGREIIMEFSDMTIVLSGRNLLPVAAGIGSGWVASLETFNPAIRDRPKDTAPIIELTTFYPGRMSQQAAERKRAKASPVNEYA